MRFNAILAALAATNLVASHPGEDHSKELEARRRFLDENVNNLDHCAGKIKARGLDYHAAARRQLLEEKLRAKGGVGLERRYEAGFPQNEFEFQGNSSCVLSPEETEGPYYVVGERIREDLTDGQKGLPFAYGVQFIDTTTCEPVVGAYIDSWHANSTGVYSGVVARQNGAGEADPANVKKTFGRGIQKTDENGIASFTSIFPGHYFGRTIHVHVLVHLNAKPTPDGRLQGSLTPYVGQFYFDQGLISRVEKNAPYNTNTQGLTTNDQDRFLQQDLRQGGHPFVEIKETSHGLVGWISFGINPKNFHTVTVAQTFHPQPTA
ncbi:hypothetical protein PT974_11022 [Cladobotryum mycophilum]|uniref:Intradiol ring-cleavage dioxygenases domain-containing protein n=1 Tax=Cladobotryum mycophilum TaxID=491253 RepID=A0ABR0SBF8_9HYPO